MSLLDESWDRLTESGFHPRLAWEIEFYIKPLNAPAPQAGNEIETQLLALLLAWDKGKDSHIHSLSKESGTSQYEVSSVVFDNPKTYLDAYDATISALHNISGRLGLEIEHSPLPFADEPPSGLHIHISLHNAAGDNLFCYKDSADPDILLHSIGGLLADLHNTIAVFFPTPACRERLLWKDKGGALGQTHHFMTPRTLSWGYNNRSTALRIPSSTLNPQSRHIEHRLPSPHASLEKCTGTILSAINEGIQQQIPAPPPVYGNANDAQYGLIKLVDLL